MGNLLDTLFFHVVGFQKTTKNYIAQYLWVRHTLKSNIQTGYFTSLQCNMSYLFTS